MLIYRLFEHSNLFQNIVVAISILRLFDSFWWCARARVITERAIRPLFLFCLFFPFYSNLLFVRLYLHLYL